MSTSTLRLLLPSLLLATTLAACSEKSADASGAGSAPRSKGFNVTAKAKDGDADEEEIKRFRLTIDGVRKMHAINLVYFSFKPSAYVNVYSSCHKRQDASLGFLETSAASATSLSTNPHS